MNNLLNNIIHNDSVRYIKIIASYIICIVFLMSFDITWQSHQSIFVGLTSGHLVLLTIVYFKDKGWLPKKAVMQSGIDERTFKINTIVRVIIISIACMLAGAFLIFYTNYQDLSWKTNAGSYIIVVAVIYIIVSNILYIKKDKAVVRKNLNPV